MKVNDENRRIRIQDPDPNPDLDPLFRGMDPRIRIHPKMSWIRNTGGWDPQPRKNLDVIALVELYTFTYSVVRSEGVIPRLVVKTPFNEYQVDERLRQPHNVEIHSQASNLRQALPNKSAYRNEDAAIYYKIPA